MLSPLFTAAASLARVSVVVAGWPGLAHKKSTEEPEAVLLNINKRVACSVPYTPVPFKASTAKTSHDDSDCFVVCKRSQGQV